MKTIKPTTRLSAMLLTAALSALPIANAAANSVTEQLKTWDADNDNTLDLAEVSKLVEARFDALDTDKDGTLDKTEAKAIKIGKGKFVKADPDKDGTLDKKEVVSIAESYFKAADPDKDGTVSAKELSSKAGKALVALF